MIIKIRSKALVIGSASVVMAEACSLMFQLRRSFKKMGFDEVGTDKIMEIIAGAAKCESAEEHIKIMEEAIDDAKSE